MRSNGMIKDGFTLVELVVVILVLAVLAVIATTRFVDLQSDARSAVITSFAASVDVANQHMVILSKLPGYKAVPAREDLTDVDVDGDGLYETRLKCGNLDNTDVVKRLTYSDDQINYKYQGVEHTYFGFAAPNDLIASKCYFKYTQANGKTKSCPPGVEATYEVVTTGC